MEKKPQRMTLAAALMMAQKDSSALRMAEIEARLEGFIRQIEIMRENSLPQKTDIGMSVRIDRECCLKTLSTVETAIKSALNSKADRAMPYWFADTVRCYESYVSDPVSDFYGLGVWKETPTSNPQKSARFMHGDACHCPQCNATDAAEVLAFDPSTD